MNATQDTIAATGSAGAFVGAILVGGASRRMGRPKHGIVMPDGRTLAERVRDVLREAGAGAVVAVGDAQVEGCLSVTDTRPSQGPLAACEALLQARSWSRLGERFVVCPCDMPGIDAALIRLLVESGDRSVACLRVRGEEEPRPLPLRLDRAVLPTVVELLDRGERSLRALVRATAAAIVEIDARSAAALEDVDTPEEWERMRTRNRGESA